MNERLTDEAIRPSARTQLATPIYVTSHGLPL